MRILIIDDDEDVREVLCLILSADGHQIELAGDGVDGIERLRAGSRPSMILLDMMMPRLDGEGVIRTLQADARFAAIPVVVISGHQMAASTALQLGAAACLIKPVELEQLLGVVQRVAAKAEAEARPA
jgi:CheY-like chemotaxis protein